jgi:hypothetical protein
MARWWRTERWPARPSGLSTGQSAVFAALSKRRVDEAAGRRQELNKMVRDFVRRMNRLGDPGTMTWTHDRIRKGVIAWRLGPTCTGSLSQLWVTPDGRVPWYDFQKTMLGYRYWTVLTPIEEALQPHPTPSEEPVSGRLPER